jgi:hypothetical protein
MTAFIVYIIHYELYILLYITIAQKYIQQVICYTFRILLTKKGLKGIIEDKGKGGSEY